MRRNDNRVQLPEDFDCLQWFAEIGQTLLDYCALHDELYNRLADYKVTLPSQVQGWHLLRRAGLTKEQRQLVLTQATTLVKEGAGNPLVDHDYKSVAGHAKGVKL
eukprot:s657_g22.t1